MKSLYDHIQALNQEEWDYYHKRNGEQKLNIIGNWDDENEHSRFIKEYLKISGKIEIEQYFEFQKIPNYAYLKREAHTNSVFFLGCILYKNLKLKDKIRFYREDGNDEFYFIWFLTSLMHDQAYYIENCSTNNIDMSEKITSDVNSFIDYFEIKYNLLVAKTKIREPATKILFSCISSYYQFRKNEQFGYKNESKIDHGIAAGLLLYDALIKIRKDKAKSVEPDGLYWGKDLEKFYHCISVMIATHNIWRANEDKEKEKEKYCDNGLEKLIINGADGHIKKLSFASEPLATLFAIVDTLEPLKIYKDCFSREDIMKNICLCATTNKIVFYINKESKINIDPLYSAAKSLESWVAVKVDKKNNGNNELTIELDLNFRT